jgi:ferredoxin
MAFCPREALEAWGRLHIDHDKCSECFGGVYRFEGGTTTIDKQTLMNQEQTTWVQLCTKYCPVGALSIEEQESSN